MKILLTGVAGFIGSNLAKYLVVKYPDYEIIGFDNLSYCGKKENLKEILKAPNFKFIKGDICEMPRYVKKIDCDYVLNLAAETHVDNSIKNNLPFVMTNCLGLSQVLEFCRIKSIPLLQFSTDEVYGNAEQGQCFDEEDSLNPMNPYSVSKAYGDLLIKAFHNTYDLKYIIVRACNNYGPNQFQEKFIPTIINTILKGKSVPVYGDGKQKRMWLYVEDTCRAVDLLILNGSWGEIYNIGSGVIKRNIEVVGEARQEILKRIGKTSEIEFIADRLGHDRMYNISWRKIMNLGWYPQTSWEQGLKTTIASYLQKGGYC